MNILQVNKFYLLIKGFTFDRTIEQAKFAYSPLGKAFEKQRQKEVDTIKSLDLSNKLKRIEGIFPHNLMNNLIRAKLKEIVEFRDIIKKDGLNYKSKHRKTYNFCKYSLPVVYIHERTFISRKS